VRSGAPPVWPKSVPLELVVKVADAWRVERGGDRERPRRWGPQPGAKGLPERRQSIEDFYPFGRPLALDAVRPAWRTRNAPVDGK
jgi:hypothetical protein